MGDTRLICIDKRKSASQPERTTHGLAYVIFGANIMAVWLICYFNPLPIEQIIGCSYSHHPD
ncbi:hypothetical protein ykris0001_10700 [Yersinia kristensenii ATCC 33638]|nr:hypothetical protein ykris0001_10700 [Yersinia kristensenii ATCC 33638]